MRPIRMATPRAILASILSLGILAGLAAPTPAQAEGPAVQVLHDGRPVRLLAPGASFTVLVSGLGGPHSTYCLGLASMHDRYGLPVSLGIFHAGDDGVMALSTRIPTAVFPAEPPGSFLLFAGRCTNVAPDGIYAFTTVTIVPAAG